VIKRLFVSIFSFAAIGCNGGDLVVPGEPQTPAAAPSATASTVSAVPATVEAGIGAATILVTVREDNGDPIEGATVTLQGSGTGITLSQPGTLTGPDGTAIGTLQSTTPGMKIVSAVVDGSVQLSQIAQVTVTEATASRIELVEGNNQSANAGTVLPMQPTVRVLNALGQPVEGVEVSFLVTAGGGSVDEVTRTTNSAGIARVQWTLGPTPGINLLEASAGVLEGSPVVFTAAGTATTPPPPPTEPEGPSESDVDRLVFRVAPPAEVKDGDTFAVQVALVDKSGHIVPLSGIFVYLDLFKEGDDTPTNTLLRGEHFENTEDGVAVLDIRVEKKGRYRLRALTDDLPSLGPFGPEPFLFSDVFKVK
jgi:Bacterial Ig-like domain (group 1)